MTEQEFNEMMSAQRDKADAAFQQAKSATDAFNKQRDTFNSASNFKAEKTVRQTTRRR